MPAIDPGDLLTQLLKLPAETEVVEFKEAKSTYDFAKLGKYFSALSNEANLRGMESGSMMTNESLRERLGIAEANYPTASIIIKNTIEAVLIKPADPSNKSRRQAKYLPYWA